MQQAPTLRARNTLLPTPGLRGTLRPLSLRELQPSGHKDFAAATAPGTYMRFEIKGREVREDVGRLWQGQRERTEQRCGQREQAMPFLRGWGTYPSLAHFYFTDSSK